VTAAAWLLAGALGAVGAVGRVLLDGAVVRRTSGAMPSGTMAVNVLGSLALGLLTGWGVDGDLRLVLAGGLIGAFTTFSTWMLETQRLLEEGWDAAAALNLGLSVALGVGAAGLGWWLASLA
jgi:CrcB protein